MFLVGGAQEISKESLILDLFTECLYFLVEGRFCSGVGEIVAIVDGAMFYELYGSTCYKQVPPPERSRLMIRTHKTNLLALFNDNQSVKHII